MADSNADVPSEDSGSARPGSTPPPPGDDAVSVVDIFRVLWRHRRAVLAFLVAGGVLGAWHGLVHDARYEASFTVHRDAPGDSSDRLRRQITRGIVDAATSPPDEDTLPELGLLRDFARNEGESALERRVADLLTVTPVRDGVPADGPRQTVEVRLASSSDAWVGAAGAAARRFLRQSSWSTSDTTGERLIELESYVERIEEERRERLDSLSGPPVASRSVDGDLLAVRWEASERLSSAAFRTLSRAVAEQGSASVKRSFLREAERRHRRALDTLRAFRERHPPYATRPPADETRVRYQSLSRRFHGATRAAERFQPRARGEPARSFLGALTNTRSGLHRSVMNLLRRHRPYPERPDLGYRLEALHNAVYRYGTAVLEVRPRIGVGVEEVEEVDDSREASVDVRTVEPGRSVGLDLALGLLLGLFVGGIWAAGRELWASLSGGA